MNKLKNVVLFVAILVLAICVLTSCTKENVTTASASWHSHFDSVGEMVEDADLVITGVMVDSYTELRVDTVCTRNIIEVTEVYSGDVQVGDTIEVVQTGGVYGDITTPAFSEIPLLELDKEYALILRLSDPDEQYGQYYLIMGGYQGILEITDTSYQSLSEENAAFANDMAGVLTDLG